MRALGTLLVLLAACKSFDPDTSTYVEIRDDVDRRFIAKRKETDEVDAYGRIRFKDVLTGKRYTLRRSNCVIRGVSKGYVADQRSQHFYYEGDTDWR